jgi:hypothetical protein
MLYHRTARVGVPLLCLVCQSVLSNVWFEELLISVKYNYAGSTHCLLKRNG